MQTITGINRYLPCSSITKYRRYVHKELQMEIKEDILNASKKVGINPYTQPFKPSDLGLNSNQYGSFSDYCSEDDSTSGKYTKTTILKVALRDKSGRPCKYLLL